LGRWVSCDPSGPTDSCCLFVYCINNPVTLQDKLGMQASHCDEVHATEKKATEAPISAVGSQPYYDIHLFGKLDLRQRAEDSSTAWHPLQIEPSYWENLRNEMLEVHIDAQEKFKATGEEENQSIAREALVYAMGFELMRQAVADRTYEGVSLEVALAAIGAKWSAPQVSALSKDARMLPSSAIASGDELVSVYRVEFVDNTRLFNGPEGITVFGLNARGGEKTLWLNFGNRDRAFDFLQKRLSQGLDTTVIKEVEVPQSFLNQVRANAVKEPLSSAYPNSPLKSADPFPDQFGLRGPWIDAFTNATR
jgi:hypothetical protein